MLSVAVLEPGKVEIVDLPRPSPGPYEALVRNEIAFICNATDRKLLQGIFPGVGPDQYPLLLGHESVGIVEEVGGRVRSFRPGDRLVGGLLLDADRPALPRRLGRGQRVRAGHRPRGHGRGRGGRRGARLERVLQDHAHRARRTSPSRRPACCAPGGRCTPGSATST